MRSPTIGKTLLSEQGDGATPIDFMTMEQTSSKKPTRVDAGNGYYVEIEQTSAGYSTSTSCLRSIHGKPTLVPHYDAGQNRYESEAFKDIKGVFQYLAEVMQRPPVETPTMSRNDTRPEAIPCTQYAWQSGAGIAVRDQLATQHPTARSTGMFWKRTLASLVPAPAVTA